MEELRTKIIQFLQNNPPSSSNKIAQELNANSREVLGVINQLHHAGYVGSRIVPLNGTNDYDSIVYFLTASGKKLIDKIGVM